MDAGIVVLTISDRRARGDSIDRTGPAICSWVVEQGWSLVGSEVIPDDPDGISEALERWTDERDPALILTTGGTGLSSRDHAPEATLSVSDRIVPGIPEWIRASTGAGNPFAFLSRGVAVIRKRTLIVNLPGSPRGVGEYLEHLSRILPHTIEQIRSEPGSETADRHPDPPERRPGRA